MAAAARVGPGQSQESRTTARSPQGAGIQALGPSSAVFPDITTGARQKVGHLGLVLVSI